MDGRLAADKAQEALREGKTEQARALLEDAIASGDTEPGTRLVLFAARVQLQDWTGAKRALEEVVQLAPNAAELAKKLGASAQAEQIYVKRLADPKLAGERTSFGPPPPHALAWVKAMTEHAGGDFAAAKKTLEQANASRPKSPGVLATRHGDRVPFADILDSDDLTGPTIPLFYDGRVFDVAFSDLKSLTFHEPEDPFEVMWRRVTFEMKSGTRGMVPMPSLYAGSSIDEDPYVRLGRQTSWDHDRGYSVAKGLRDYWVIGGKGERRVMGLDHVARIDFGAVS